MAKWAIGRLFIIICYTCAVIDTMSCPNAITFGILVDKYGAFIGSAKKTDTKYTCVVLVDIFRVENLSPSDGGLITSVRINKYLNIHRLI